MDFEANSYALGIPVFSWGDQPYKRLLAHAHEILTGGSLLAHMPKPAGEERQIAALCMLVKGIGMKKAKAILESCGCIGNLRESLTATSSTTAAYLTLNRLPQL